MTIIKWDHSATTDGLCDTALLEIRGLFSKVWAGALVHLFVWLNNNKTCSIRLNGHIVSKSNLNDFTDEVRLPLINRKKTAVMEEMTKMETFKVKSSNYDNKHPPSVRPCERTRKKTNVLL